MSPLVSEPLGGSATTRLVSVGPITLPTLKGELVETVGEQLETVGAGVVAGDRRPRALPLTIPVRGDYLDANRRDAGLRLRRQVRALLENSAARMQGLYLNWSVDPEQNGWLLIGGGDLKYAQGGITFADFEVALTDCYRVGNRRSCRPARRIEVTDRRLITTPRDILGRYFWTDFNTITPIARHYLGVGVTDPESGGAPVNTFSVTTRDGALVGAQDRADGQCISYEQAEIDEYKAIVRVYDTHGSTVETDWEAVYGPDQPLVGAPVLDNALARVVPDVATGRLDVQSWTGSAWVTDATVTPPASSTGFAGRVLEWTTERAVLVITANVGGTQRVTTYVTLQRGWQGPRVETYHQDTTGAGVATTIGVHAKSTGDSTLQRSSGTVAIVSGTSIGTFAAIANWALLLGPGTDRAVHLAVQNAGVNLRGAILSSREGVLAEATGYVSVQVGTGPRASGAADAAYFGQVHLYDQAAVPELVSRAG